MVRADGTKSAKVIQVIETKAKRGLGTEKDPVRDVTQYWDLEGNFLAEMDVNHLAALVEFDSKAVKESI
ncbi:MAG: carboxypeptidase [Lachnospiraceae bacterium]|nr:carboxypeptidase [Lachnospiraceae bacterium]